MQKKFYLTTAIAYVNGAPHIGHALEFIQSDAIARYMRQAGRDVYFLTGTDEHGVKIVKTAQEKGVTPQELADENSAKFRALREKFNLSWDDFIRTSDKTKHWPAVTKLWNKLIESGDLYEKEYEGLYCYGCEEFKKETDLIDGNCPNHNRPPEVVKEKNWFFRLSKYSDAILEKLESREVAIVPEFRAKEIINVVKGGLHDVSFSRPKENLKGWGIPVPNDSAQLMYVWCDALTNYISAIDYANEGELWKWWPADIHCIGKDIVRFHAGIWIGMLLAAKIALPKQIYVHGFITSEGQKMSKSLGNVVEPEAVAAEWGIDALRYYLLAEIPNGQDGDFSAARFAEKYNSDLANGLGNLVSRVITMGMKIGETFLITKLEENGKKEAAKMWKGIATAMENYDFRIALENIFDLVEWCNKYVDETKPWELAKTDAAKQLEVLSTLLEAIRQIALALLPFIPETAEKIAAALSISLTGEIQQLSKWGSVKEFKLTKPGILFPKKETK